MSFEVDLSNKSDCALVDIMWHTSSSDSSKWQPPPCRIAGDDAKWQWQPPPPSEVKSRHRDIGDIWPCCTDAMGWETVKSLALRPGLTLGGLDWRLILKSSLAIRYERRHA